MIKKGKFTKCMGCQFEKEECDEVKYEKCSFEVTKPNCHRKKNVVHLQNQVIKLEKFHVIIKVKKNVLNKHILNAT